MLDVKEAIKAAKKYVSDIYSDEEAIMNLGLEETEYDVSKRAWKITLAFSRPFNTPKTRAAEILDRIGASPQLKRSYKIVTVRDGGQVVSMKDRPRADIDA